MHPFARPLVIAALIATAAAAHAWPDKPVRIVVPAPAGSSLDVIARALGDRLAPQWKQPVVVENKPGAGGMIGVGAVAKAAPDGHVLAIGFNGPIAFGPFLYKKMAYDPSKDLVPVVMTTSQPNVLAVPASHPAKTLGEFVTWARQQGKGVSYGSVGAGSSSHLTMELFRSTAGFEAVHVPYSGSPPAATSVAAGDTQALFTVEPALLPMVQSGRVRLLASTGLQRMETVKDLPTVAESGYPGFEAIAWNGLFVPTGTPAAVVAQINADVNAALADPAVRATFDKAGLIPGGGSATDFRRYIESEARKWGATITRSGITID
jgi:tripartite-type tricarboxylate transporter receptor subunit TctC